MSLPDIYAEPATVARIELIATSFQRLLGRPLVRWCDDPVSALWDAPRAVVAHGTEADPLFFFANRAGLKQFDSDLDGFIGMPSRLSAEAPEREDRQAFLERVARQGFVDDYSGLRVSARGQRFTIRNGTVWNLVDGSGAIHGQAATFEI